jgi:hypothetical protein
MEDHLIRAGRSVRVIEDCLNGRRTVWEDPFKPGRNGLTGLQQRIEVSSPLGLVVLLLGTNDFQRRTRTTRGTRRKRCDARASDPHGADRARHAGARDPDRRAAAGAHREGRDGAEVRGRGR